MLIAVAFVGDPTDADDVLAPYRQLATPLVDMSQTMSYVALQAAFDPLVPDGGRYYFKSHFMNVLTDDAIAALVAGSSACPNKESFVVVRTLGGAIARVSPEDSVYPHRDACFNVSIDGIWSDPDDDAAIISWARHTWDTMQPFANGGIYLNFAGFEDEQDVTQHETFGPNLERLERGP